MPQRLCNCIILFVFVFFNLFVFLIVNVNCCQNFCGNGKTSAEGDFLYFLDNDMDLWVEFWKFVSKCFQVFTWPYVYISMTFQKGMYSNST